MLRFPKVETMNNGDGRKTNAPQMVVEDGRSAGALALVFLLLLINGVQGTGDGSGAAAGPLD